MVMSLGSSAEPIGGGSTYLRVVRSVIVAVSECKKSRAQGSKYTLLRVDLHLHVEVDPHNDEIGDHIENADAQKDLRVLKWYLLGHLHHAQDNEQIGTTGRKSQPSSRLNNSNSSREHMQGNKNLHLRIG